MLTITVSNDLEIAGNDNLKRAVENALGRTLRGLRADIARKVRERYTLKRSIKEHLKVKVNRLVGTLKARSGNIGLNRYRIKPMRRLRPQPRLGVFAEVIRGQGEYLRRAFLVKGGAVMERDGEVRRLPIRRLYGPSVQGMLSSSAMNSYLQRQLDARISKNLHHSISGITFWR